jgi:hypothetical protein
MTGTKPRASVSDTRVWQLAVLPNAEAYCAATPTEWVPFLTIAVSSITSTNHQHRIAAVDEPIGFCGPGSPEAAPASSK